ncbi:substrate-binding domain-containing protein [Limnoglobus roseus]|uniref:Autoinducer 2 import system permease protein LsrD n=1 Tax=Limnoglobus roseus TaxID=2598579 RepID=A0A5C1A9W9_9BACT|nr:substrate-binding domain-containing protein [Limnoglobus roseus]QEL14983.1 ABC transporter permease [Limnoglobus roseus]
MATPPNTAGVRTSQPGVLLLVLLAEVAVFGLISRNFLTLGNAAEVSRLSVEIGLLAVALTPVIVGGGIDLSVGALLGLSAVAFGWLWRNQGLPVGVAAVLAVGVGALGGTLNGLFVARLRLPPLIVTLGSLSLFRGLAKGFTGGTETYTGFPAGFLAVGQGYFAGVPVQLPIFVAVAAGYWLFLHRTIYGRAVFAIGFSPEGARHAGIPVERRVFVLYLLSGLAASVAGVVYVAHLGQAKADAGTGYELAAITAVVLGGTSIFGGRGGIAGTVLGLLVIAVLDNGLLLADLPRELAGVLTGVLLLVTITIDRLRSRAAAPTLSHQTEGEFEMKNSQLAVLCVAILAAAGIVAASNWYLMSSLRPPAPKPVTIAMLPKSKGNPYFLACRRGADEAAAELGVELLWDGPDGTDPAGQNRIVEGWMTRGVDVICVAVENREGLSPVLRKARAKGIKVLTWDADAEPDARDLFVNQATPEGIGHGLMDTAARVMGGKGEFAIITGSLTASNLNEWRKHIEARLAEKYPDIKLVVTRPCDDQQKKALDETKAVLAAHPNVKLVMAVCSPAVPGAAEAVKQLGRGDVKVIGLGLPNENKPFVHAGVTDTVILWNTMDLGYLTIHAAKQVADGKLKPTASEVTAGRLGRKVIDKGNVLLGQPFAFTKENIDQFDF